MFEVEKEQNRKTTALLVGAPNVDLFELRGLADTLGLCVLREESGGCVSLKSFERA